MEQLDHQAGKAFEGAGDADGGGDFDEDAFGGVDVDLQFAGFVDGGVEEGEETLFDRTSRRHAYPSVKDLLTNTRFDGGGGKVSGKIVKGKRGFCSVPSPPPPHTQHT